MPPRRKRSFFSDGDSDCHRRHDRGLEISDSKVKQVSQYKWLVEASESRQKYTVTRKIKPEDVEDHRDEFCEHCGNLDYDKYFMKTGEECEELCKKCEICCEFYTCNCPDDHGICKHIHKIHTMTERLIAEQGPWTLHQVIQNRLKEVENLGQNLMRRDQGI